RLRLRRLYEDADLVATAGQAAMEVAEAVVVADAQDPHGGCVIDGRASPEAHRAPAAVTNRPPSCRDRGVPVRAGVPTSAGRRSPPALPAACRPRSCGWGKRTRPRSGRTP